MFSRRKIGRRGALTQTRVRNRAGIALHLMNMGRGTLSTASAMGRMFLAMTAAFAELERNLISERTASALAHRKSNGQHTGAPPYGYRMVNRTLVPVPEELAIAAEMRQMRADGVTFKQIAALLTARNVPTKRGGRWTPQNVHTILSRAARLSDAPDSILSGRERIPA